MASRSYGHNSTQDWDPMQEDFSNSNYDPQYPDNNSNDHVKLDHCRLYITNIPKALNDDGLRTAFMKYGSISEVFVSKNPVKRYGMVAFETPAEARHAMMKLNRTEPLRLNISIAHEKKEKKDNHTTGRSVSNTGHSVSNTGHSVSNTGHSVSNTGRSTSTREQSAAGGRERADVGYEAQWKSSSNRNLDEMANGDNLVCNEVSQVDLEDDLSLETFDPDLQLELDKLQLERLRLQQAQVVCKQRMLLKEAERRSHAQTQPNSRSGITEGKAALKHVPESRSVDRIDGVFAAGAGDSLKIPGLQRVPLRACVTCGAAADAFCARCGVTPYCSVRCQRRDWTDRHSAVCHNLARMNTALDVDEPAEAEVIIPPPAPLRRPRSPPREPAKNDKSDAGSDRGTKKFIPPGHHSVPKSGQVGRGGGRTDYQTGKPDRAANQDKPNRAANQDKPDRVANQDKPDRAANQDKPDRAANQNKPDRVANQDKPNRADNQEKSNSKSYRQPGLVDSGLVVLRRPQVTKNDEAIKATKADVISAPETQTIPAKKETPLSQVAKKEPSPSTVKVSPANQKEAAATNIKPPGSTNDVTPTRKLVPKNCLIDVLSKGDSILVSVEGTEEDGRSPGKGFVGTFLSEKFTDEYSALCEDYAVACEADSTPYTPSPGDTLSVYNPDDESWYRARCLSAVEYALLDCGKVLAPEKASKVRSVRLPAAYEQAPEFSGVLQGAVEVGTTLKCVLNEKTASGWTVEMFSTAGEEPLGRGEVSRWLPTVQYSTAVAIPEVPRPGVSNNSAVWLVEVTDCNNVFVRASDADSQRAFDGVLHDAALAGLNGAPLTTPPAMGSYVISKFTDGLHYRALVKRTSVKLNKYLLEYVEFGNCEVNQLENLCRCPENLLPSEAPTMTSRVSLRGVTSQHPLTPAAKEYLDTLKDDSVQLVLTIPDVSHSAPSGTEVVLTVESNKENVNKKVEELCTPEWLKIQRRGGDVVETQTVMYSELQFVDLAAGPLVVLDFSALAGGSLSACRTDRPQLFTELDALTDRMTAYCESELGREPYLPKVEELCIAQMPPYTQWYRAVLAEQVPGPGGAEAEVCYVDYGNMARIPVSLLRKMLPEFAAMPAIANTVEIIDFPKEPTNDMILRALKHLDVDEEEGRGKITVSACEKTGPGWYKVRAPGLLAAMAAK